MERVYDLSVLSIYIIYDASPVLRLWQSHFSLQKQYMKSFVDIIYSEINIP